MENSSSNLPIKQQLIAVLQNNRVFENFYTHVSLIQPKGKFSLASRDVLEDFWYAYNRAVLSGEVVGLAEVPKSFIPVVVDIDLKFSLDSVLDEKSGYYYSEEFVKEIIDAYQQVILETVDFPAGTNMEKVLRCAWLSKDPYFVEKEVRFWKNGFHLHFYNLFVNRVEQETRIIPLVLKKLEGTILPPIMNPGDFFDKKAINNSWMMYGSAKDEGQNPYLVHRVYDSKLQEIDPVDAFADTEIYDTNDERISFSRENYELYLPRIFSIVPARRKVFDIKKVACVRDFIDFSQLKKPKVQENRSRDDIREETRIARDLVKIMSPQRSMGHNDWMSVGWALFNITDGSEEGMDIWIQFSLQTDEHDEARCIYEWSRMKNRGSITIGTLKFYARQDNEKAYLSYMAQYSSEKNVSLSEKGLADLMASNCQGVFVYCKKRWFEFVGHFWRETDEGINVIRKIESVLVPLLRKMRSNIPKTDDGDESEGGKKIGKILSRLETTSFSRCVLEWCKIRFHDQDFLDSLDKNRYLIGFKNGVYDLQQNIFRNGDPADLITNHMPIDYKEFRESDDEVAEVKNFFEKIFPTPNIRRYFLDIMSEIFVGYNHRKHVYFLTGEGDNGKSMTQMFFEKMLGKLSIKAPTTIITSKKPAIGAATEELARSGGGVRAMWMEEPNADEEISQGILKHLSGNDSFYTRGLYQTGREIEPMFKMFVICNSLPPMKHGGDKATWNRIRVIKFESTFSNECPKTPEEQLLKKKFPKDNTLDQRIPHLTQALAWFLLEHRKLPRIDDPPEVLNATNDYRSTNDIYAQFVGECFVAEEGSTVHDLVAIDYFKEFLRYSINKPHFAFPPVSEFGKIVSKYIGQIGSDNKWKDYRIRVPRAAAFANDKKQAEGADGAQAALGEIPDAQEIYQ